MIRVLIVEDDQLSAEALTEYVGRVAGFEVAGHARSGTEALQRVATGGVDLVLLDIYLPLLRDVDPGGLPKGISTESLQAVMATPDGRSG